MHLTHSLRPFVFWKWLVIFGIDGSARPLVDLSYAFFMLLYEFFILLH